MYTGAYQLWNLGAVMSDRDQNLSTSQRSAIVHPGFTCCRIKNSGAGIAGFPSFSFPGLHQHPF